MLAAQWTVIEAALCYADPFSRAEAPTSLEIGRIDSQYPAAVSLSRTYP